MFIQTEDTPNPATMKFLPGRAVMVSGTMEFNNAADAAKSPLAQSLFAIAGVTSVFLAREFITVTKDASKDWMVLKPSILTTIMEHFAHEKPVLAETPADENVDTSGDSETVKQIREILDMKVRPAVAQDGGDITFHSFEDGIVFLNLKGSCAGCPSSTATLKVGVERMLKHYIPEIKEVRQFR